MVYQRKISREWGWPALLGAVLIAAAVPVLAAADGQPVLDPTGDSGGTNYDVRLRGMAKSMDVALGDGEFISLGTMTVFQGFGNPDFKADMGLDTDGNNIIDRVLKCDGFVGRRRFGMRCEENGGGADLRFHVAGKAKILKSGLLAMRKSSGRGHTEGDALGFGFRAIEQ